MKLNPAKYKMRPPRILNWFDKYRFDFWQLLHQYSWLFWGFHLDICYMGTFSITSSCPKKAMKLNSYKYKMPAPISLNWFDKYRFDITWHLCKAFGYFHNASTSIHLGTLQHQPDVGGSTYIPITTSSVDQLESLTLWVKLICNLLQLYQ